MTAGSKNKILKNFKIKPFTLLQRCPSLVRNRMETPWLLMNIFKEIFMVYSEPQI
jgi:hypothetical protein